MMKKKLKIVQFQGTIQEKCWLSKCTQENLTPIHSFSLVTDALNHSKPFTQLVFIVFSMNSDALLLKQMPKKQTR